MKIRNKITIRFTLVVITIIGVFSLTIYFLTDNYRLDQFYSRIKDRALTTAKLLIDVQEVDSILLTIIDKNTIVLPNEKVEIYDSELKKIYCSVEGDISVVSDEKLKQIISEKEEKYNNKGNETLGIYYNSEYGEYIIVASAFDEYGLRRMKYLRTILIIGMLISAMITMISGWFFSGLVLKPVSKVINQVDKISVKDLSVRVDEGTGKDEISQLATTFNKMLDRVEQAFVVQRTFVSSVSHELRTPLTSVTGQIEVTLMKERSTEEYKKILQSIDEDIKQLNSLANGLIELTYLNTDLSTIVFEPVRIDEILWNIRSEFLRQKPNYEVVISFLDFHEKEEDFIFIGNEHLLKIAIRNLIENGCKFSSDNTVIIQFKNLEKTMQLIFINNGKPIPESDHDNIFLPFYRSSNAVSVAGYGLGLPMVKRIINILQGEITVTSNSFNGTIFTVTFPLSKTS